MENLENRRLLFAVALDPSGCSLAYYGMLQALRGCDILLRGSVAGVIVTGVGEFYTKDVARDMVFAANQAGLRLSGPALWWRPPAPCGISASRPRSAAWTRKRPSGLAVAELVDRLTDLGEPLPPVRPGAGPPRLPAQHLQHPGPVGAGEARPCRRRYPWRRSACATAPCPTATGAATPPASTSASRAAAFTAAPMVEEVYPAVRRCDALVMLCANYNDALSANLTACVNRLTALFRQTPVLRQAPVRPGGVRLFRRGPAGPSADLGAEYEQVLFPAAPLLPAGNRQRAGQSDPPARHPEHRRRLCERDDDAIKQALRLRRRACAFYSMSTVMLSVPCCSNSPRYSSMRLMTSS